MSTTNGELGFLWQSPISIVLWACAALMVVVPLAVRKMMTSPGRLAQPAVVME